VVYTLYFMVYTLWYIPGYIRSVVYHTIYDIYIYHGISNSIYVIIYHGIYHIISVHSFPTVSMSPAPPVPRCSCCRFNFLNCSLSIFCQTFRMPLRSFYHSALARLPPPIAPQPELERIEPASVASPSPLDSPRWNLQ
jgi:hypothetical protein